VADLLGATIPAVWDGQSFAASLRAGSTGGRDHLVLSCGAWATQRSIRLDQWLCIRTYHDAFHGFQDVMLFDVDADPHEQCDQTDRHPEVVGRACRLLVDWE